MADTVCHARPDVQWHLRFSDANNFQVIKPFNSVLYVNTADALYVFFVCMYSFIRREFIPPNLTYVNQSYAIQL